MRLIKLEISGFKSFADRAKIIFPKGVSAIVGPNGCGKSNVVDALRWVMGEQSVKKLRGKNSNDIIFSGAENKHPVNLAEVSLTITNEHRTQESDKLQYTEYMITRKIFRSGENQYFLNRQPCRLKDIQALFLGTGTGKNSFAVIQQGNIGALTEATPEQLRYYIEDAADVTKYKAQKKEVLLKINSTKENLERIYDISLEVTRQMDGLRKQAQKAEKFLEYQKEIRLLDIVAAHYHKSIYTYKIREIESRLEATSHQEKSLNEKLEEFEKKKIQTEFDYKKLQSEIKIQSESKYDFQRKIDKNLQDISHSQQSIADLETEIQEASIELKKTGIKNDELQNELNRQNDTNNDTCEKIDEIKSLLSLEEKKGTTYKNELKEINEKLTVFKKNQFVLATEEARYTSQLNTLIKNSNEVSKKIIHNEEMLLTKTSELSLVVNKLTDISTQTDDLCIEINDLKEGIALLNSKSNARQSIISEKKDQLQTIRLSTESLVIEYNSMKNFLESYEGFGKSVAALLKMDQTELKQSGIRVNGILKILGDTIQVDNGYEKAVQTVLSESLHNITLPTLNSAADIIHYINRNEMGDCGFIIPDLIVNKDAVLPREKKFDYLSDHIHFEEQTSKIIQAIVGETIVVNSAHDLLSLYNTFDTPQWIVTKNGDFAIKNGFIRGGGSKNTSGLIERKNRLTTLEKNIAENYDLILKSEKELLVLTDELNEIISYFNKTSVDLEDAENELRDNEKRLFIINEEKKQIETTQKILQLEKEQYEGEAFDIDNEITAIRKKIDFVNNKISSETKAFEAEEKQSELITIKIEDQNKICTDLKLDLSKLLERNENYAKSLGQLQNFIDDGLKRFSQLKTDISNKSEKCKLYNEKIENAEKDVEIQSLSLSALSNTIEIKENALLDLETLLKQNKDSIENINLQISMVRDDKRDNELNLSEITIKKSNIETGIQEKYHYPVSILIQEHRNEVTEELALIENSGFKQFEKRLSLLKVQIQNLGEINHSAIREFEELKKRNDFIQGQHADLTNALEELNKIIIRINKITQNKFIETFNQINDKLSEIFPRLFEGGSGELKILEPSNLLETGVEFLIKPPGKKLTNLGLLSGGEKALCAIAFIFSIFLIKPSSFCIMDEIDAPLDDANVFRFNNLIKIIGEQSQILIITHNKLTMEFADILFGVTMEKKGVSKIVSVELDA